MNDSEATAGSLPRDIPGLHVLREIGSGLRGTVYAVSDGRRTLALKVFRRGVSVNRSQLERFLRGAADGIRHPHLLRLESLGETPDGCLTITMPLLHGDSLETMLADLRRGASEKPSLSPLAVGPDGSRHPLFHQRATEVILGATEGLALAHREGMVHGHLGPRNLILSPGGKLVVTDFGSGATAEGAGAALVYRAPEQLEAFPSELLPAADVYSLGVVLYELCTGRPPFTATTPRELKRAIFRSRVVPPRSLEPAVPADLEACILEALEREPQDRYRDAGELAEDLGRFLRGEPTRATAPRTRPRLLRRDATGGSEAAAPGHLPAVLGLLRMDRRTLLKRGGIAALLAVALVAAVLGGHRIQRESKMRDQSETTAHLVRTGEYSTAIEQTEKFASLNPGNDSSRMLSDYARSAAALDSLERATSALGEAHLEDAISAAEEASRFRPRDSRLTTLVERLRERSREDPVARDLDSGQASVRAAALQRLTHEISTGARSPEDARLAARVVRAEDHRITRGAIETLALLSSGREVLEAFGLSDEYPFTSISGSNFDLLCGILEEKLDQETAELFCEWDFDSCEVLDEAPRPFTACLPPNLEVEMEPGSPRGFRARWIRILARHDPALLLESLPRLTRSDDLAGTLVAALSEVGTPEARDALAWLARRRYLRSGYAALSALADMGAYCSLLEIAQGQLPVPYREMALTLLGEEYGGLCTDELSTLALRSPEPAIRRLSFHYLSRETDAPATEAIPAALGDPMLRPVAYSWLDRLPRDRVLTLLGELLSHPEASVRMKASAFLVGHRTGGVDLADLLDRASEARRSTPRTGPEPWSWLGVPLWTVTRDPLALRGLRKLSAFVPKALREAVGTTVRREVGALAGCRRFVAHAESPSDS